MTTTWKCLLGAFAVCALFDLEAFAQVVEGDDVGVVRMQPADPNPPQSANRFYGEQESIWLNEFQPPPGYGVDPATVPQDDSVGYAVTSSVEDILYRIDRVNRNYHGFDGGFTGFNAFIPMRSFSGGTSLIAVDTRAFVTDYGSGGLNLGFIGRRYVDSQDRVYGLSGWFDYDDGHRAGYAQLGLHGSIIGRWWSFRSNLQTPVGQSHERYGKVIVPAFHDDQLLLRVDTLQEVAYSQIDFEVAVPTPGFARYGFETGLQYYYLNGAIHGVEDGHGIGIRNEAQITEDVWLNTYLTSDTVFGSNLSINLQVTLPNGPPSRFFRRLPPSRYLVASDKRPYRVLTNTVRNSALNAAVDPQSGDPIRVAHIDPNAGVGAFGAGSVGTFDRPFGSVAAFESLADAEQSGFDIILVRGRNDGTDTNLNTTITLFDDQQLLGTGVSHFVSTTQGLAPLPDLPFSTPLLSNSAAPGTDVVRLADMNVVSGLTIDAGFTANAINGLDAGDFGVRGFNINRNTIQNAIVGVEIDVEDTPDDTPQIGIFMNNLVSNTTDDGLRITYDDTGADSGVLELTVTNNTFEGVLAQGIDIDLSGNAVADLQINDNTFAYVQQNQFITGVNFTGTTLNEAGFVPPDTNGAVSNEHIAEMTNGAFAVYDKATGALITRITLDEFWTNAGVPPTPGNPTNSPRMIFDPSTNRWFAASIEGGFGNNIYVAVSDTSDPSGTWSGFRFVGDTQDGIRTNIVESLGVDADGVYISTNNLLGGLVDVSIYSIPKADLVGPTPSIGNMTRFENLSLAFYGLTIHGASEVGASDGVGHLLGIAATALDELVRIDLSNTNTANATLGLPTNITVPPIVGGGIGFQPNSPPIFDNLAPLLASNVVKQGNSIWAVHTEGGTMGTSAVRWYEIDATTNTLLQTGLIEDPNIDFLAASVAVNERGQVAIGFTGTGFTQAPSAMAVMGSTAAGVTTFGTPVVVQGSVFDYNVNFNEWGGYSATVRDPNRSNVFWTFQEFVAEANVWGIQITELISGNGGHDGILVNARGSSTVLNGSNINRNTFVNGTGTGISVNAFDDAFIDLSGTISDNVITNAGVDGMFFSASNNSTVLIDGDRNSVTGSGRNGLFMQTFGDASLTVDFRNSQFDDSGARGVQGDAAGSSDLTFTFTSPFDVLATGPSSASNNIQQGILLKGFDTAFVTGTIDNVLADTNSNAGISAILDDDSTGILTITNSSIINGIDTPAPALNGEGIELRTFGTSSLDTLIENNLIDGNVGSGLLALADGDSVQTLEILDNTVTNNEESGLLIDRRGSALMTVNIENNLVTDNTLNGLEVVAAGASTGALPADVVVTSMLNTYSNNGGDGINYNLTGAANVFATHICDIVDSNGDPMLMTGNGVSVTTNTASFFGTPPNGPSLFDSLVVTNNGGNGYVFTQNGGSTLIADIVSDTKPTTSLIANNTLDGVEINDGAGSGGVLSIGIGNAANPAFDVTIDQNLVDAVDINILGGGTTDISIANTLISGALFLGVPSDPGVTIEHTGSANATIFIGQDFSAGRVLDWTDTSVRGPVTITNIAGTGDAINLLYNPETTATHSLLVADSLIGGQSGSVGGDGVQLDVQDDGFIGRFFQNRIIGTGGDGIRLITMAEEINGATVSVPGDPGPAGGIDPPFTAQDGDANNNQIGDFPTANSPFLNALGNWVDDWGDSADPPDVTADLIIGDTSLGAGFGGNVISGNSDQGIELSVGGATLQNVIVRGNTLGGNTNGDFVTSTATNTIPGVVQALSVDRAEGMPDDVVLDPLARLNLFFGDMAGGAGSPNTGNVLLPGTTGGVWSAGDAFKPAGRAILTDFVVTVPDEMFPPADNLFTLPVIGDQDEEAIFTAAGWTVNAQ